MKNLCLILIFVSTSVFSQNTWDDLSGEQKAFFYNIARRTEILKPELLHLFEFTDSLPYINDTLPDYKYVEREVIKDKEKLVLHTDQMARKPNGLVSDLATHFALWELSAVLKFRNSDHEMHEWIKPRLRQFEKYAIEKMPLTAVEKLTSGNFVVRKPVFGYFEPSLQTSDKMAGLLNSGFSQNDQMLILNAIAHAEEKYIRIRSKEIFEMLGGQCEDYENYISAAGDGSGYSSLEGGIFTPYNQSLPDDKGMFTFNVVSRIQKKTYEETHAKRPKPDITYLAVEEVVSREHRTIVNKNTVVHFDVYGYHPERQTTIAIQKGGASYILYGKNEHRLLSPDSTYGEGTTYWRLMWELENVHIAKLNEALYGKRGYEYWIDVYEKKIEKTLLLIKKTEYKLDELRHKPEGKTKIKKKKFNKKNLGTSDQAGTGHPTSALSKNDKKKNIEQNRLIHLNTQLENEKQKLKELKYEMEVAYFILQDYKTLLDKMQKHLGYLFMDYEQDGEIYTFNDGATFNYATQDFTFPPSDRQESFMIYHIAFGKTVFAKTVEESFVHMQLSSSEPKEKYTYRKIVSLTESTVALSRSDSIQQMEIFRYMLDKDLPMELTIYGGGVLGENEDGYYRDSTVSVSAYNKEQESKREAREYKADWDTELHLSVEVWMDEMLPYNFAELEKGYTKLKSKYPQMNEIDYVSAIKAKQLAQEWIESMKRLASIWFEDPLEQAKINRKLTSVKFSNVKILDGNIAIKVK
ncbi:MAG: hypothetical protein R2780_07230 [Crocinitomicaceae bacterium]|nr:hypothetical protein [Crocinitomicaceae bacterium]